MSAETIHHDPDCYCDECQQGIAAAGILLLVGLGGTLLAAIGVVACVVVVSR